MTFSRASCEMGVEFVEVWLAPKTTGIKVNRGVMPLANFPTRDILHELGFIITILDELFEEQPLLLGKKEGSQGQTDFFVFISDGLVLFTLPMAQFDTNVRTNIQSSDNIKTLNKNQYLIFQLWNEIEKWFKTYH